MKIALLSAYSGPVHRGIESWVHEISQRLEAFKHDVTVYQLGEKSQDTKYNVHQVNMQVNWDEPNTWNTKEREYLVDYWSRMLAEFTLQATPHIINEKPDMIIPLNGGWETKICKEIATLLHAKLVLIGHWLDIHDLESDPDLYISLTKEAAKEAKKYYSKRITVIPDGVDIDTFKPHGEIFNHGLLHPVVLCASAFVSWKHIDKTIAAVSKLKDVSFLLVGDGDLKGELKERCESLLRGRYRIVNAEYKDMPSIYRSADIFTLFSGKEEAFGMVYLEAMASGLPIVTVKDAIRIDVVGNAGILVENNDTKVYSSALLTALQRRWGDLPRKQAEKFSWEEITKRYEEALQSILV
ncbi:MAG: glycosyltransferase family 4 protein [Candidatus Levyibacteriota bacterium]